jgi:hypothetical protein
VAKQSVVHALFLSISTRPDVLITWICRTSLNSHPFTFYGDMKILARKCDVHLQIYCISPYGKLHYKLFHSIDIAPRQNGATNHHQN